MRLRYTPEALAELDEVLTGIGDHSRQGAFRIQARIKTILDLLLDFRIAGSVPTLRACEELSLHLTLT